MIMKKAYRPKKAIYDSNFEENFHQVWKSHSTYPIVHHHTVHLSNKWELDFCFPQEKIVVELQGFGTGHTSYKGMQRDYRKHNDLVMAGWIILYFMSADLKSDERRTIDTIKFVLEGRNPGIRKFDYSQTQRSELQPNNLAEAARRLLNKRPY